MSKCFTKVGVNKNVGCKEKKNHGIKSGYGTQYYYYTSAAIITVSFIIILPKQPPRFIFHLEKPPINTWIRHSTSNRELLVVVLVFSENYQAYTMHYTLYNIVQYTLNSLHYTVYSVQYSAVYSTVCTGILGYIDQQSQQTM